MQQHKQLTRTDCYRTCIACILDMSPGDVPDFCNVNSSMWMEECQRWFASRGMFIVSCRFEDHAHADMAVLIGTFPDTPYILSAMGPRGKRHSVVGQRGKIIHDPHPDGGGVEEEGEVEVELIGRLVGRTFVSSCLHASSSVAFSGGNEEPVFSIGKTASKDRGLNG